MNDSVSTIIHQIDETIGDAQPSRDAKIERLKNLATACWNAVIPEYGTERFKHLDSDDMRKRWATVRNEVEKYGSRARILYVLDWPASGGNFYWVK